MFSRRLLTKRTAQCSLRPRSSNLFAVSVTRRWAGTTVATPPPRQQKDIVNIVEVGPRDGLQNEKGGIIPFQIKVDLINRLVKAGLTSVEAGSFVSPKWVPQMAGTADVLKGITQSPSVHYPVLIPNQRGLEDLLNLLSTHPGLTDEIAVFTAATDSFTRANLNCTIAESLTRIEAVMRVALDRGLRVRGYVSVVVECPYEGPTDYKKVKEVTKALVDMGCYEVSLGETVGRGRPHQVRDMLEEVKAGVAVEKLAGHFHDTYGTAVANVMTALDHGVRTIDASVGGLGGCPYAPGATGNVATEDVLYALEGSKYHVAGSSLGTVDLKSVSDVGWWISGILGRESVSRTGRAIRARQKREPNL